MLRDGRNETLDHSFTSKTTDLWTGQVTVKEISNGHGIFFNGVKGDTFPVAPAPATDYLLGIFLRKEPQLPVKRAVEFRASDRIVEGSGATVEVTAVWALGFRKEHGSFSVPFMVGS
jgi:hypothetical protein